MTIFAKSSRTPDPLKLNYTHNAKVVTLHARLVFAQILVEIEACKLYSFATTQGLAPGSISELIRIVTLERSPVEVTYIHVRECAKARIALVLA